MSSFKAEARDARDSRDSSKELLTIPAVSGYEQELLEVVRERVKSFSPTTDNVGNVMVTIGSGAPHRLIVTAVDEPGYVVSEITDDGFLRVQRLPQRGPNPIFDLLHAAQPVLIMTRGHKHIPGVFAGLSVHLQPGRMNSPTMAHPDEMYVDIGASSATQVRDAGVDVLDPVALSRVPQKLAFSEYASAGLGDRAGCVALVNLIEMLGKSKARMDGTLTIAFAVQRWTGGRGLDRLLNEVHPNEMIYVGRFFSADSEPPNTTESVAAPKEPSGGILLRSTDGKGGLEGFSAELKKIADEHHVNVSTVTASVPRMAGYAKPTPLPDRFAQIGVRTLFPLTPAETVDFADLSTLTAILYNYTTKTAATSTSTLRATSHQLIRPSLLSTLTETYGASGHEEKVREVVKKSLPEWAKPETDGAGNLVLHLGDALANSKTPKLVFIAHMDEIGYQVKSIEADGRLLMEVLGGGYTEYFMGHPVLLQKSDGTSIGGVLELPKGWDQQNFKWPSDMKSMDEEALLYIGTHSAEETDKLGIKVGDWATVPKRYRALLGARANARSFDDRVGCAALIEAVKALGPNLRDRDVTFIWSTQEEVGLNGAAAAAERMAKEGRSPNFVFAIDTFVSSDSPMELKRFANAQIGKGFVLRAVDNSNIAPREFVDRVVKLAKENKIPVQYGVTGGGNDGAVFVRYGAVDVPLGWPLRYSHSPGEVIDIRDLDALGKIVAVIARSW